MTKALGAYQREPWIQPIYPVAMTRTTTVNIESCPKCGNTTIEFFYDVKGHRAKSIKKTCARCKYSWTEKALDSK